jgi:hypothetical protein
MYGIQPSKGVLKSLIFEYFLALKWIKNKAEKLSFSAL